MTDTTTTAADVGTLFFKVLAPGRAPLHGGNGAWPEVGAWTEEREVKPCKTGWHLARPREVLQWLRRPADGRTVAVNDREVYLVEAAAAAAAKRANAAELRQIARLMETYWAIRLVRPNQSVGGGVA